MCIRDKQQAGQQDQNDAAIQEITVECLHFIIDERSRNICLRMISWISHCTIKCVVQICHDTQRIDEDDNAYNDRCQANYFLYF
jgi:hypothetical protein